MKLSGLQSLFSQRKVITYAKDGNTAIKKNKDLQQISGNLYKGKDETDQYGQLSCRLYIFYEDIGIGIDIGNIYNLAEKDIDEITSQVPSAFLHGSQSFIKALDHAAEAERHITNAQIALAGYIAPENVAVYTKARQRARDKDDERQAAERAEQNAEDVAYCEKCNAETQRMIEAALDVIRSGGILKNDTIKFYLSLYDYHSYSVINHLARQYGVKFPLKVQGWINKSLTHVRVHDDEATEYWHTGGRSTTFLGYMDKLIEAVLREDARGNANSMT